MATLALILGLGASAFIVILSIAKSQRTVALVSILLSGILVGQYLALNQPTATALSGMSLLYGVLIYSTLGRTDGFSRAVNGKTVRISLLAVYTLIYALLNGGIALNFQFLALIGSVLMVAVMMVERPWISKLILLLAGIAWTIFQFHTGAYGNLVGQLFYFIGLGWSSWKLLNTAVAPSIEAKIPESRSATV